MNKKFQYNLAFTLHCKDKSCPQHHQRKILITIVLFVSNMRQFHRTFIEGNCFSGKYHFFLNQPVITNLIKFYLYMWVGKCFATSITWMVDSFANITYTEYNNMRCVSSISHSSNYCYIAPPLLPFLWTLSLLSNLIRKA